MRARCPVTYKAIFKSKTEARSSRLHGGARIRPYRCKHCGGVHVTTKDRGR